MKTLQWNKCSNEFEYHCYVYFSIVMSNVNVINCRKICEKINTVKLYFCTAIINHKISRTLNYMKLSWKKIKTFKKFSKQTTIAPHQCNLDSLIIFSASRNPKWSTLRTYNCWLSEPIVLSWRFANVPQSTMFLMCWAMRYDWPIIQKASNTEGVKF